MSVGPAVCVQLPVIEILHFGQRAVVVELERQPDGRGVRERRGLCAPSVPNEDVRRPFRPRHRQACMACVLAACGVPCGVWCARARAGSRASAPRLDKGLPGLHSQHLRRCRGNRKADASLARGTARACTRHRQAGRHRFGGTPPLCPRLPPASQNGTGGRAGGRWPLSARVVCGKGVGGQSVVRHGTGRGRKVTLEGLGLEGVGAQRCKVAPVGPRPATHATH